MVEVHVYLVQYILGWYNTPQVSSNSLYLIWGLQSTIPTL